VTSESTIGQIERTHQYYRLKSITIEILRDLGLDVNILTERMTDEMAATMLRSLLGEELLNKYMSELKPMKSNLN